MATRVGGLPQLSPDTDWPRNKSRTPLSFLAQLNLREISQFPGSEILPSSGLLSFFYEVEHQPWGFYEDKGNWYVTYTDPETTTELRKPPSDNLIVLPSFTVQMKDEITIPARRSIELDRIAFRNNNEQREAYFAFRDKLVSLTNDPAVHRVFGHPDAIQGCMQRIIQFESRNEQLPKGVFSYYEHARADELIPGAFDWCLLLQLDSDDELGQMWGDSGRVFFWMHKDTLARRRFSESWLRLQCY